MSVKRFIICLSLFVLVFVLASCGDSSAAASQHASGAIKGTVSIPSSAPISAENLRVKVYQGENTVFSGSVNSDGSFVVNNLEPNSVYTLLVTSNTGTKAPESYGYGCWKRDISPTEGNGLDIGTLQVKPLGSIQGKVNKTGASTHYDITVYIPGSSFRATTDAEGNFSISNVPQGTYPIRYVANNFLPLMEYITVSSPDDTTSPVVVLPETRTLIWNIFSIDFTGTVSIIPSQVDAAKTLTTISIPDEIDGITVRTIKESMFSHFPNLTSVTLPSSLITIENYAFAECPHLSSIVLPDSVRSIGNYAFYDCQSLESINLSKVTTFGSGAFSHCPNLATGVNLSSATTIGPTAFEGCSSITNIVLPDTVTSLPMGVFYGCSNLSSVTLPNTLTRIYNMAFYICENLVTIILPKSLTYIETEVFAGCTSLTTIYYNGSEEDWSQIPNVSYEGWKGSNCNADVVFLDN